MDTFLSVAAVVAMWEPVSHQNEAA
jgi:hypothetical protein